MGTWLYTHLGILTVFQGVYKVPYFQTQIRNEISRYCGWKKSCTTLDSWKPVNNGINPLSTGAGFLPSTVSSFLSRLVGAVHKIPCFLLQRRPVHKILEKTGTSPGTREGPIAIIPWVFFRMFKGPKISIGKRLKGESMAESCWNLPPNWLGIPAGYATKFLGSFRSFRDIPYLSPQPKEKHNVLGKKKVVASQNLWTAANHHRSPYWLHAFLNPWNWLKTPKKYLLSVKVSTSP